MIMVIGVVVVSRTTL